MTPPIQDLRIADYTYVLPAEKIAVQPLPRRDDSRLLVYREGRITDARFNELPGRLPPAATLVLNDTRVIEARLLFQKPTGGVIELFCLEPQGQSMEMAMQQTGEAVWQCFIGGASKWKSGQVLQKAFEANGEPGTLEARYLEKREDHFLVRFSWRPQELPFLEVLHHTGAIPLPPYIKRKAEKLDWERYQTVFGKAEGSVAAPTASLHFTEELFSQLAQKAIHPAYLTLHVGAGTFRPVTADTLAGHAMHGEPFTVSAETLAQLAAAKEIVAVGTTSLRTLESLHWLGVKLWEDRFETGLGQWEAYELEQRHEAITYRESYTALLEKMKAQGMDSLSCRTSLLIAPGYRFKVPAALITNFHQPQSTLLLLVAAFIGEDWRKVYDHALANGYRFLSYGDSSLLWAKR